MFTTGQLVWHKINKFLPKKHEDYGAYMEVEATILAVKKRTVMLKFPNGLIKQARIDSIRAKDE